MRAEPDIVKDIIKKRKNAFKTFGGRLVKVTYCREGEDIIVITAVIKGE